MSMPDEVEEAAAGPRAKRSALVARIADVLMANGMAQIPLRDLAAELGTSDRMLLYYFDDKVDLVTASLQAVSARLEAVLVGASDLRGAPEAVLVAATALFGSPPIAPFMNVWADISARGGRGEEPFRSIAQDSVV